MNFLPSVNGFFFANNWPSEPDMALCVPLLGQIKMGDASNGLCGGMTFAVADLFRAGVLPDKLGTDSSKIDPQGALFE